MHASTAEDCSQSHMLAVARIALVKPEKAKGVENMILQMAQRGQLTEKVCNSLQLVPRLML